MHTVEAAPLPTASNPYPQPFLSHSSRGGQDARTALADALVRRGISVRDAHNIANATEAVWTDFPEVGITTRIAAH